MWPLLSGGEQLRVRRCDETHFELGDIAVLLREDDRQLIAHSVVGTAPLRTAGFLGKEDPPGLRPLAKAEVVRRAGREIPLERLRPLLHAAQRSATVIARSPMVRTLWNTTRASLGSSATGDVRSRLLAPHVRRVSPAELAAFAIALSRWETLPADELEALVARHAAAGVWARGQLAGTGVHGSDGALRHLHLRSWLRHTGAAERLLEELWQPSISRAEVAEEETDVVSACESRGLVPTGRTPRGALILSRR